MHTDGLGQIFVRFGIVGHHFAHKGQGGEGIQIVGFAHQRVGGLGKFQHQQTATRLQAAGHGTQRGVFVGNVAQTKGDGDHVEAVVFKRQAFSVGLYVFNIANVALIGQAVAADIEHGRVDISQHHFTAGANDFRKFARQVTGTAGQVQHPVTRPYARHINGDALPQAVHTKRHQVVHQVVLGGDGMKHLGHFGLFLFNGHGLVTKMCGFIPGHTDVLPCGFLVGAHFSHHGQESLALCALSLRGSLTAGSGVSYNAASSPPRS